jgi:hypothetical protein
MPTDFQRGARLAVARLDLELSSCLWAVPARGIDARGFRGERGTRVHILQGREARVGR